MLPTIERMFSEAIVCIDKSVEYSAAKGWLFYPYMVLLIPVWMLVATVISAMMLILSIISACLMIILLVLCYPAYVLYVVGYVFYLSIKSWLNTLIGKQLSTRSEVTDE